MKIVRHKVNHRVLHAGRDFSFVNGSLTCPAFKSPNISQTTFEIVEVPGIPADWVGGYYTYYDTSWVKTQYGIDQLAAQAAAAQALSDKVEDMESATANVSNDALVTYLSTHTLEQIDTYVADQFSALAGMTPAAIDAYLDTNVTDLASAKGVLKVLAKDLAATMAVLKVTTKMAAYVVKRDL